MVSVIDLPSAPPRLVHTDLEEEAGGASGDGGGAWAASWS